MEKSVGQIGLDLVINKKGYDKQLKGITGMAKKAGAIIAAAFTVKKMVDFGKQCVELGSDLEEVQNVVDVTFPNMTAQVDNFAKSAAGSFGLSETMAKKFTGTFGAMAKAFGFSEKEAYVMSTTLTGLAGDVASFYNISQDEAYTKLKSVFTGETESLKDLGVVMTQTALDSYALANGFGKTTKEMTEAEKVALRYFFVQNQLTAASGDFARTSDSWANQVRILQLQFDSLRASIGQGLINVLTPVIKVINTIIGKIMTLANAFKAFTELLTGKKSPGKQAEGTGTMAEKSLSGAAGAADNLTGATTGAGKAAKKAAKEMKALMGFDKIQKMDSPDKSDSDGSAGGGSAGGGNAGGGSVNLDTGALSEMDSATNEFSEKMVGYFNKMKAAIEPTVVALKRLWNEGLAKLGTFSWNALKGFYEGFLLPVGSWVLGEGFPGFIDALNDGLMKVDFDKINASLGRLWDVLAPFEINIGEGLLWFWENVLVPLGTWTVNEVVPRFLDGFSIAIESLNGVIEALKPLFEWLWDNVLVPIAEWTAGEFLKIWDGINDVLQDFADFCNDELSSKVQGFVDKLDSIKEWCSNNQTTIEVLGVIFGGLAVAIAANAVASNGLAIGSGAAAIAMGVYNGVTAIATGVTGAFSAVLGFLTSPITLVILGITALVAVGVLLYKNWDKIKVKAAELWNKIKETFQGIGSWFAGKWGEVKEKLSSIPAWFKEKFKAAYTKVKETFQGIGAWFGDRVTAIKNKFTNIPEWFKSKFSEAWKRIKGVFSGVGSFFGGIWSTIKSKFTDIGTKIGDAIGGTFKTVINGVLATVEGTVNKGIGFINGAIGVINKLPGVNIGKMDKVSLPRLAQGGYVKANTPQLAMIGDNRHQGEIVAPEDKLREMAMEAVKAAGSYGGGITKEELERIINNAVMRIVAALHELGFNVDGEQLAKAERVIKQGMDRRFNSVEIVL